MADVEIYSSPLCGFCYRAKHLLEDKGIAFTEIDVLMNGARKQEMVKRSGGRTSVPQIFINDQHVGGCDDLYALDRQGSLDAMLAEENLA